MPSRTVFIGLMSGTSLDGVDGVLVDFGPAPGDLVCVLGHAHAPMSEPLRAELLALNRASHDEIERAALTSNRLAREYAAIVGRLLRDGGRGPAEVAAIGCHGQTVRHRPGELDGVGYTTQLNAPALLAELTGIDVVADFRSRDIAAGGQGAPLVPAFHRAVFGREGSPMAVLNLGGIANLTALGPGDRAVGFDCGPANVLLDLWCGEATGRAFDVGGSWAASGTVDQRLLTSMLTEGYFRRPAPKSTGRDLFNRPWLDRHLAAVDACLRLRSQDIQATLSELTAQTCSASVSQYAADASELVVCGGGARNGDLIRRLQERVAPLPVVDSSLRGLPADQVEACAFAWLARRFTLRLPGNLPAVTGARGPRVLGALYPAG